MYVCTIYIISYVNKSFRKVENLVMVLSEQSAQAKLTKQE